MGMVTIKNALDEGIKLLKEHKAGTKSIGFDNYALDANVLLCHILKKDKAYLIAHRDDEIPRDIYNEFLSLIKRRCAGEPVAYIINKKEFWDLTFYVDSRVLIPRPDTEVLVEYIIDNYKDKAVKILDIGTGSGAIAVTLKKHIKNARVFALDVSGEALDVARKNARLCGVEITFFQLDILKEDLPDTYDIIVSNPPYIESRNIPRLIQDVRDFEPEIALDGGEDGLKFYRRIVDVSQTHLKDGGLLAFEVGFNQAEAVLSLMEGFYDKKTLKDLSGISRVVLGKKCPNQGNF